MKKNKSSLRGVNADFMYYDDYPFQGKDKKEISKMKCFYDFKTKNESFIKLYDYLTGKNIENNKFFLKIFDIDLVGINPYESNLSDEMKSKIIAECKINPWYYLREVYRVRDLNGLLIPFSIDIHIAVTWYLFLNGIDTCSCKPYSTLKNNDAINKINYVDMLHDLDTSIIIDAKKSSLLYKTMQSQRYHIPNYISNINSPFNMKIYHIPDNFSKTEIDKIGRGITTPVSLYLEFKDIPLYMDLISAAAPAYKYMRSCSQLKNNYYGRLFTITPGDIDKNFNAFSFIKGMTEWNDKYLDFPINLLKESIEKTSLYGIVYVEHTWKDIGKLEDWYTEKCELLGNDKYVINTNLDLKWIQECECNIDILEKLAAIKETGGSIKMTTREVEIAIAGIKMFDSINSILNEVNSPDSHSSSNLGTNF